MLDVKKIENKFGGYGSCNFCNRGRLNESGHGLVYPYDHTYEFVRFGGGLKAQICDDCLKELNDQISKFKSDN